MTAGRTSGSSTAICGSGSRRQLAPDGADWSMRSATIGKMRPEAGVEAVKVERGRIHVVAAGAAHGLGPRSADARGHHLEGRELPPDARGHRAVVAVAHSGTPSARMTARRSGGARAQIDEVEFEVARQGEKAPQGGEVLAGAQPLGGEVDV